MESRSLQFLIELQKSLSHLPASEVEKVISFYGESIQDKIEDGLDEESIVRSFGSIDEIVKNIEEEVSIGLIVKESVKVKSEKSNVNKVLVAIIVVLTSIIWIPLLFAVICVAVGVYAMLWSIPISVVFVFSSFAITSVSAIFFGIIRMFSVGFLTGISYIGVGFLFAGIVIMFFKPIVFGLKKWIGLNILPFKKLKKYLISKMKKEAN